MRFVCLLGQGGQKRGVYADDYETQALPEVLEAGLELEGRQQAASCEVNGRRVRARQQPRAWSQAVRAPDCQPASAVLVCAYMFVYGAG